MAQSRRLFTIVVLILFTGPVRALEIGDPAPPLKIDAWVKGDPVDLSAGKGKRVYVVEFWATWCGPCREAIPHLSEIQKKFKDKGVTIVGISDETESKVKPFVKERGDKMEYVVAIDKDDATGNAYMKPFNVGGIPHAFIVDKEGRLVWHGHPEVGMEEALEQVVAGKYDLEAARNAEKARKLKDEYFELLVTRSDTKKGEARERLSKKIKEAAEGVVKYGTKSPEVLNDFSWTILTSRAIKEEDRDRELALKAAKIAVEASGEKNPSILDTYARALFDTGSRKDAVKYQKKAIEISKNDDEKRALEKTLREYESQLASGSAKSN